jgi:hypothetical protein
VSLLDVLAFVVLGTILWLVVFNRDEISEDPATFPCPLTLPSSATPSLQPLNAESCYDVLGGASVISRRSPKLHPVDGGGVFYWGSVRPMDIGCPQCYLRAEQVGNT